MWNNISHMSLLCPSDSSSSFLVCSFRLWLSERALCSPPHLASPDSHIDALAHKQTDMWRSVTHRCSALLGAHPALARSVSRRLHVSLAPFSTGAAAAAAPLRVIQSHVHEACFNIAFEEHLFKQHYEGSSSAPPADHTLFLWSNSPAVIMGKHQNPHREVHLDALRQDGVDLVRRKSGGGCVYHDRGNAIFSFISRDTPSAKGRNNEILLGALGQLGFDANASGRNDIEIGGRKVSGCAFKRERGWLLHHGTMLVQTDLVALPRYLNPSKAKLLAKGVASVASRVTNLRDLDASVDPQRWDRALTDAFLASHGRSGDSTLVEAVHGVAPTDEADFKRTYEQLKSFDWVHGSSPEFSHEFTRRFEGWGSVTVGFQVGRGHTIQEVHVYSDSLQPVMIEIVDQALKTLKEAGRTYSREEIDSVLQAAEAATAVQVGVDAAANVRELREWLLTHF